MVNRHTATYRDSLTLPSPLHQAHAQAMYPPCALERARLAGTKLVFDSPNGFARGLEQGFFLLKMPQGLVCKAADQFAQQFYLPQNGFLDMDVPGLYQDYFDRPHDQWENFYIERANWHLLPQSVAILGTQMAAIGISVLRSTLAHLKLPVRDWPCISSGLSENGGHQMLAFNHFRSSKKARGCKFHRDSGWVTVLRSTEPGLYAWINGQIRAINPEPGYFIINFGSSFEVLTERLETPVRANIHGVAQLEPREPGRERTSYALFLDSALDGTIYQYRRGRAVVLQSVADFAEQEVARTYDRTHTL